MQYQSLLDSTMANFKLSVKIKDFCAEFEGEKTDFAVIAIVICVIFVVMVIILKCIS